MLLVLLLPAISAAAQKKILYVDSYHESYPWSAGITRGIQSVLENREDIELKIIHMDTKRNKSEAFKTQAAMKALKIIEEWEPEVVVASDDNAVKYLVEPFLNNTDLPVVFCGVNWNLDNYTLATDKNITGIIEIAHYVQLIETLQKYTQGRRIGHLTGDNLSDATEVTALNNLLKDYVIKEYAVDSFSEWKVALDKARLEVDILLINNNAGIAGWNTEEARKLIYETVSIPTGTTNDWMATYNLLTYAKSANEQGEWAANAALDILRGKSPQEIPVAISKKAKIILNMNLAKKLGIKFPIELIERASFISELGLE